MSHKRYYKNFFSFSLKSDKGHHIKFINLDVTCYDVTQNVFALQKLVSVWSKHQRAPDKLSSSSSCCLPITFNRFTKNTNYLQERRGLSCQKVSHSNRYSTISSHPCCECVFFQQKAPCESDVKRRRV